MVIALFGNPFRDASLPSPPGEERERVGVGLQIVGSPGVPWCSSSRINQGRPCPPQLIKTRRAPAKSFPLQTKPLLQHFFPSLINTAVHPELGGSARRLTGSYLEHFN